MSRDLEKGDMLLNWLGRRIPRILQNFVYGDWERLVGPQRCHYFHTRLYVRFTCEDEEV
jgi:hypothetical protein